MATLQQPAEATTGAQPQKQAQQKQTQFLQQHEQLAGGLKPPLANRQKWRHRQALQHAPAGRASSGARRLSAVARNATIKPQVANGRSE
jgi:hypothetical protein